MVDPYLLLSASPVSEPSSLVQSVRRHCNPAPQGFVPLVQDQNSKQEIIGLYKGWFKLAQLQIVRKSAFAELRAASKSSRRISFFNEPVLVDIQETCDDSVLLSFGIAKQCLRHENIVRFMSGCRKGHWEYYAFSLLSELMGFHRLAIDVHEWSFCCLDDDFSLDHGMEKLDEARQDVTVSRHNFQTCYCLEASDCSRLYFKCKQSMPLCKRRDAGAVNWLLPEAHTFLLPVTGIMKQVFPSNSSEVQLTSIHVELKEELGIVPYFANFLPDISTIESQEKAHAKLRYDVNSSELQTVHASTVMPNTERSVSSPERLKSKHHPRKKTKRLAKKGRDLFKRSQFHLYECMLSVIFNNDSATSSVLELKNADPVELTTVLNQIAVALAGCGLAIMLSVTSKMLAVNALLDSRKLLNVILGLGFIWLSCAIQKLRDVIISVTGTCSKLRLKEKQSVTRLKEELNSIFFKAFTLMAFSVLRLL